MKVYDYIIVGAGAAGSVLANRLSEHAGSEVLLIEAGRSDRHPFLHMPRGLAKVITNPAIIWPFQTEPEKASNDTSEFWTRGKVFGGSTSINGMVYVRGQKEDYQQLAELAGEEWGWPHMASAFRSLEAHELGGASFRGGEGALHITLPEQQRAIGEAVIEAGIQLGLARKLDINEPEDVERIGYVPCTIYRGKRQSASVAFLSPVSGRENLTIASNIAVDNISFENGRAVAVIAKKNGERISFRARGEIIICGGALSTPAILQRSGIGPKDIISELGIPVVFDAPEVGRNLREHRGVVMQWKIPDELSLNREFRGGRLVKNVLEYYLRRRGPMAGAAYEIGAWVKTSPSLPRPDVQILMAPFTFDYSAEKLAVESCGGMNMAVYNLRPASTGSVYIQSANPDRLPQIKPAYDTSEEDRKTMVSAIKYARQLVAQEPLSPLIFEETRPGRQYQSDQELAEAWRLFGYTNYHASGTCRMGQDNDSVVDSRLRVRGVEKLRVVDTSVFPFMLSGNTMGPMMGVAWRAADLILEDRS